MSILEEVWIDVVGFSGKYQVSTLGNMLSRSVDGNYHPIFGSVSKKGYVEVALMKNNKKKTRRIHRLVYDHFVGNSTGCMLDHVDRDPQNNVVSNLRLATDSQNQFNKGAIGGKSSKFKGVYWDKERNKWRGSICYLGQVFNLGRSYSEIELAKAYDKKALVLCGEFACTNEMLKLYEGAV